MEELYKKLLELNALVKAIMPTNPKPVGFSVPKLQGLRPPAPSPMKVPGVAKDGKIPGLAPDGKKDPKKIAQQIKEGSMSTKTQKVMLKFDKNGQWSLDDKVSHRTVDEVNPTLRADKFKDNKR
jgi:hypothetical protein